MALTPSSAVTVTVADSRSLLDRLFVRVADGDRQAFAEVYSQLESRVFGVCLALLRDRQQAEEVAQEVFLHVWQHARAFDQQRGPAVSWVLRIARGRAIDRIRHSEASRMRDTDYARRSLRPDSDVVVEQVMLRAETNAVQQALALLSEKQREAVLLSYYGAMSSTQISHRLGVPAATVKTRIRDGVIKLGAHLAAARLPVSPAMSAG